ncbi:MAG: hypothetical protein SFY56_15005 [Bacteroidota bacterium]|nr:hypothetical protein [Bacteroidota bacterium]
MKKYHTFLILFFIASTLVGQKVKIEDLLLIKPIYTQKLNAANLTNNTVQLKMDFNSPVILNASSANPLKNLSILKVELYYTAFQVSERFSQPKLNKERLENLKSIFPELFDQSYTTWEFKAQNDCKEEQTARSYFHGFVITYIPRPTAEDTKKEITKINAILKSDSLGFDSVYNDYFPRIKNKKIKTGFYIPVSKRKREMGIVYTKKSVFNRKPQYVNKVDTLGPGKEYHKFVEGKDALAFVKRNVKDSTVFSVLRRQNKWREVAFVCDVTGSMSPYTTQLLVWYKLNCMSNTINYFTFFNDGDNKEDRKKKIGNTGGIYNVEAVRYDDVEAGIQKAMMAGSGGDGPENNCEALLETIKHKPDAKEYVMVADNFANVKDIKLMSEINKPIHIIICGMGNAIVNTDYLDLARATKGSIHSIEQDIDNLMSLNEGQTITFNGIKYILHKGRFHKLTGM